MCKYDDMIQSALYKGGITMKIMVSGIGGIGGYIACIVSSHYDDVTLIARKARKQALLEKGLILHSQILGEQHYRPKAVIDTPSEAGIQDVIFICVKNFSLLEALSALKPCIDDHTIVVPIMNGVDHCEVTDKFLKTGYVIDALIYLTGSYEPDFSIVQKNDYAKVVIDSPYDIQNELVRSILNQPPGLQCVIADDMESEVWQKYITNCAYNVITAYYKCTTRGLLTPPSRLHEFHVLLEEAYAVGLAKGVHLPEHMDQIIFDRMTKHRGLDSTSSMGRDAIAGKQTELETFSGYLVRTAHALGVPVPLSEHIYEEMKARK